MTPPPEPAAATPAEDPRIERSRTLLIQAATDLLASRGIDAVTIDAVTAQSGVSRATLYRHFSSGTELVAAAFAQLIPPVASAPTTGSLRDRLLALLTEQARLVQEAPLHITLLSWVGMTHEHPGDHSDQPRLRELRKRIIEHYREPFDAILDTDEARTELGDDATRDTALAQLAGPLIFNRLITQQPINHTFCARVVDDFIAARRPENACHPADNPGRPIGDTTSAATNSPASKMARRH